MSLSKVLWTMATLSLCWAWEPSNFVRPLRENGGIARAPMRRRTTPPLANGHYPGIEPKQKSAPSPEGVGVTPFMRQLSYLITMYIGNPEQKVMLAADTGSSDVWVNPYCTEYALINYPTYYQDCLASGFYLTQQTLTGKPLNLTMPIEYGSGFVEVDFWKDSVSFPESNGSSFELRNAQFGVARESLFLETGIFGLAHGKGYNQNYSSFIDDLYDQGFIQDKDFGVSLGAVDADNGEILFGGYDTSKFTGYFQRLPLMPQQEDDPYFRYWVNCTYIGVTPQYGCESYPVSPTGWTDRMLVDTGTTLVYLPETVFYNLLAYFPAATYNFEQGLYELPCDAKWQNGTVDFGFINNFTIQVPIHEFIFVVDPMPENSWTQQCFVGAQPSFGFNILGDVFLRSVYLLFCQMKKSIYMAQASNCGTNVVSSHGIHDDVWGDCDGGYGGPDAFEPICETASYSPYTATESSTVEPFSDMQHAVGTPPLAAAPVPTWNSRGNKRDALARRNGAPPNPPVVAATHTHTAATRNSSASGLPTSSKKKVSPIALSTSSTTSHSVSVPLASSRKRTTTSRSETTTEPTWTSTSEAPCDTETETESASPESSDWSILFSATQLTTSYTYGLTTPSGYPPSQPTSTASLTGFSDEGPMSTFVQSMMCYPTDSAHVIIQVTPGQTIIVSDDEGSETIIDGTLTEVNPRTQTSTDGIFTDAAPEPTTLHW